MGRVFDGAITNECEGLHPGEQVPVVRPGQRKHVRTMVSDPGRSQLEFPYCQTVASL